MLIMPVFQLSIHLGLLNLPMLILEFFHSIPISVLIVLGVENDVSFTFGHSQPHIVIIIVFLGLAKANFVPIGSHLLGKAPYS
jgi:hypothetical protein